MANADTLVGLLDDVGDAIRAKTGGTAKLTLAEMPDEIAGIETGAPIYAGNLAFPILRVVTNATYEQNIENAIYLIEHLVTRSLTGFVDMFNGSAISINTSVSGASAPQVSFAGFNTSSATSMIRMFKRWTADTYRTNGYPRRVVADLDLTSFDTSRVTSMLSMFEGAMIETLDISSFDTSRVTNMQNFLQTTPSSSTNSYIAKLITGPGFTTSAITSDINKPKFCGTCKDENNVSYGPTDIIPDGAHTYTYSNVQGRN